MNRKELNEENRLFINLELKLKKYHIFSLLLIKQHIDDYNQKGNEFKKEEEFELLGTAAAIIVDVWGKAMGNFEKVEYEVNNNTNKYMDAFTHGGGKYLQLLIFIMSEKKISKMTLLEKEEFSKIIVVKITEIEKEYQKILDLILEEEIITTVKMTTKKGDQDENI